MTNIPDLVTKELWVKAGGRCQYEGCNRPLLVDPVTLTVMNCAYRAHIIGDSTQGPRGDKQQSAILAKNVGNLMLLCDVHHRLIDKKQVKEHPAERLRQMKFDHEMRIATVTSISRDMKTEILLYDARIDKRHPNLQWEMAATAVMPNRYPISREGIMLSLKSSFRDNDPKYWEIEAEHLRSQYKELVVPRQHKGSLGHVSVFAIGPQPLLILLGTLLSDLTNAEIFQLHREPPDWCWQEGPNNFDFIIEEPAAIEGPPALMFSLSADINVKRIETILGGKVSVWTIKAPKPGVDFLKSREQLQKFRVSMRNLMNQINTSHGGAEFLHVFPAMPVSAAVEFGRILLPKADLPLRIYDQNLTNGGFVKALDINVPPIL